MPVPSGTNVIGAFKLIAPRDEIAAGMAGSGSGGPALSTLCVEYPPTP
jgi:hypothetical protein